MPPLRIKNEQIKKNPGNLKFHNTGDSNGTNVNIVLDDSYLCHQPFAILPPHVPPSSKVTALQ